MRMGIRMITITTGINTYRFDSVADALKRICKWTENGLASEKESCAFIIQLFNQIPDSIYNQIIDEI